MCSICLPGDFLFNTLFSFKYSYTKYSEIISKNLVTISNNDYHFKNMQDGREEKIITDSSFKVVKGDYVKKYHLECQSTIDNSMSLRIFEYDAQIALDDAVMEGEDGKISYSIPIIKMQRYSLKDIWEKEIYLLIPFYIFTHEANLNKYNKNKELLQNLLDEFAEISNKLNELADIGKITEFEKRTIMELSKKVVDSIARKYSNIRKGVDRIMGGKVIETEAKKY